MVTNSWAFFPQLASSTMFSNWNLVNIVGGAITYSVGKGLILSLEYQNLINFGYYAMWFYFDPQNHKI